MHALFFTLFLSSLWIPAHGLSQTALSQPAESIIDCKQFYRGSYEWLQNTLSRTPNNATLLYQLSLNAFCLGRDQQGVLYGQRAVTLGHVGAASLIAMYYKSDKTFKNNITTRQAAHLNLTIEYIKKAVDMIEQTPHYPDPLNQELEQKNYVSFLVFLQLPNLHYVKYMRHINPANTSPPDENTAFNTIETLTNIKTAAEHCLAWPALKTWGIRKTILHSIQQTHCLHYFDFALYALLHEPSRLHALKTCSKPVKECEQYNLPAERIMNKAMYIAAKITNHPMPNLHFQEM